MNTSETLRVGYLLIATIVQSYAEQMSWPCDNRTFALAVDMCKSHGNELAQKFYTTDCAIGRRAADFDEMLTLLFSAALIEYRTSSPGRFWILAGPRFAGRALQRHSEKDRMDAVDLVGEWSRQALEDNP